MFKQYVVIRECCLVLRLCAQQAGAIQARAKICGRKSERAGIARERGTVKRGTLLGDAEVSPQFMQRRCAGNATFEHGASGGAVAAVGQHPGQCPMRGEFRIGTAGGDFKRAAGAGPMTQMLFEAAKREPISGLARVLAMAFEQCQGLASATRVKRCCRPASRVRATQALVEV